MLTRNMKCLLLLVALAIVLLSQTSSAITMIYEAEDAARDGDVYFGTDSGIEYVLFKSTAANIEFTVNVRDAGNYPLTIRYKSPFGEPPNEKREKIFINGEEIYPSIIIFPYVTTWDDYVYGNIPLNSGDNIIRLERSWGYVYYDYIALDGFPVTATNPNPEVHETVTVNLPQLSWTNPAPLFEGDTITSDVYLGLQEPNSLLPNYGLTQITAGTANEYVDVPYELEPFTTYYWVVDCWDPNTGGNPALMRGYSWDFDTNNSAPEADAGQDQHVGLGNDGDPQTATVILDGTGTTDDGLPSNTINYLWQQLAGPAGVVIYPYDTPSTTVTLSVTGIYEFSLTADDTLLDSTDTVIINVYESECEVYISQDGTLDLGDITEDCIVDIEDLVALVRHWLECNSAGPCVE